jgi:hypothetical protein
MITKTTASRQPELFTLEVTDWVVYNTSKSVPIREAIIALQGLEGLLKPVPAVLSALTGVEIDGAEFVIQSLESGSLIEHIAVKFFFKSQAELDAVLEKLGDKKGMKALVIASVVGGLAGYGLHAATAGTKTAPAAIQATNSVIIQNGAGVLNVTPEAFQAAIAGTVAGAKKKVAESSLKFTAPVRADCGSVVAFGVHDSAQANGSMLAIPYAAVAEAPPRIELEANSRIERYTRVPLAIRAADLDNKKRGWAGRLGVREERLPIELDPEVSEAEMFGRETVRVDADLIFQERGKSHELRPTRIYVRKVYPKG